MYMHDPRHPHLQALKCIIKYIQGTFHHGLQLFKGYLNSLIAYSDADWTGCPDTKRSTSGYYVFLGLNLISWSVKRQPTISRSSPGAEYKRVANTVAKLCWIRNLMLELHFPIAKALVISCDNISSVYISTNHVKHQRTKYIELDNHFVREEVAIGEVKVIHVPSSLQYADIFTKFLPTSLFNEFRTTLIVRNAAASTKGEW